jgi:hypothetical protein
MERLRLSRNRRAAPPSTLAFLYIGAWRLSSDCNGILPRDPPKSNLLSRPRHAGPGGYVVPRPATRRTSSGPPRPQNRLRTIEIRWVLAKDYG